MINLFIPQKSQSHRQEKVGQEIRHILSMLCIQNDMPPVLDEDDTPHYLNDSITITHVDISPDLQHAKAYFRTLLGNNLEEAESYLNTIQSYFRYEVGKKIRLRYTPTIRFVIDSSIDDAGKIDSLIQKNRC